MKHLFLSLLTLCFAYCIQAQNECYEYVAFEDFLETKVNSDTAFIYAFYKNIPYPKPAVDRQIEEKVEVLLIYREKRPFNSPKSRSILARAPYLELIPQSSNLYFKDNIKQLEKVLYETIKYPEESVMTRFYVWFHLGGFPISTKDSHLQLHQNNTIIITDYINPMPTSYKF